MKSFQKLILWAKNILSAAGLSRTMCALFPGKFQWQRSENPRAGRALIVEVQGARMEYAVQPAMEMVTSRSRNAETPRQIRGN